MLQIGCKLEKWQLRHNFPTWLHRQFFFDVVLFLLSSLVTGPSFMSISSLVLELWQFSFIRDWPEIRKSEILPSQFCPISGDWGKLWTPNLARMFLIKCYWMLQISRITAFTVFELLRDNQLGGGGGVKLPAAPPTPRLGLKTMIETVTYHDVLTNNRVTFFDWFLGRGFHWNVSTWCCEQLLSVNFFFIIFFFRCIIPDFFSMKKFPVPAMFFPLYIPFGGIIELISSLLVSGDGFAIIAVRKFVIDSPTGPNILSLTK